MTISKTERDALLAQFLNDYLFDQSEPTHGEEMTSLIMSAVDARIELALVRALPVEEHGLPVEEESVDDESGIAHEAFREVAWKPGEGYVPTNLRPDGTYVVTSESHQPDFAAMAEHLRRCPGDWEKILTLTKPTPAPGERDERERALRAALQQLSDEGLLDCIDGDTPPEERCGQCSCCVASAALAAAGGKL